MSSDTLVNDSRLSASKRHWLKIAGAAALAPVATHGLAAMPFKSGPRADYFPNSMVQTHDGRKLRFYDDIVHGKLVIFNMMYTVCTGICPSNTANLMLVQEALGDRLGKDVFMYSMTLQPKFDDPSALRDYVKRYDIKPGWTFLTGLPEEMDVIRRKLGFFNDDPRIDGDLNNHTGMIRVGHERLDRWFMMPTLSSARNIAREVLQML